MTKEKFLDLLAEIQNQEYEVLDAGNKEYANSEDTFANFNRLAESLEISREKVLITYAGKHWDGILSYVKGHRSQREDVRGRIKDLRLYLALLWGMVEEGERGNEIENTFHVELSDPTR